MTSRSTVTRYDETSGTGWIGLKGDSIPASQVGPGMRSSRHAASCSSRASMGSCVGHVGLNAAIYEKHRLSACLNVVAAGLPDDAYIKNSPLGDFELWNELKRRGHEIMPHGYRHENLAILPLDQAQELVRRCLGVFSERLSGFDPKQALFNFPCNASTPELERWLPTQVRAFRTGGGAINPWPHRGQVKLTCVSSGPGNCEAAIDRELERLLARKSGWLVFTTHGLDEEGWGPIRAAYLEGLLERLLAMDTVEILPAGRALAKYAA